MNHLRAKVISDRRATDRYSLPNIATQRASRNHFYYGGDTVRAQFIQLPVELLSDPQVSALELRLYAILLRYGLEGSGWSQAGHQLLGKNCNCHPKTIARCLKHLQVLGWITIERIGLNRNDKIRCLKTVQKKKSDGTKPTYQGKTQRRLPTLIDKKDKNNIRPEQHFIADSTTAPNKAKHVASKPECYKSRSVDEQFKEAQQALTTELENNLRPASLHWFQRAIITEDDTDQLTISLGHEQVEWVEDQYAGLLDKMMCKKVNLRS